MGTDALESSTGSSTDVPILITGFALAVLFVALVAVYCYCKRKQDKGDEPTFKDNVKDKVDVESAKEDDVEATPATQERL